MKNSNQVIVEYLETLTPHQKKCKKCQKIFQIEAEDLEFYKKIATPPPTFCPDCRRQRRLTFRNERKLYKRKCDATGKEIVSIYATDKSFPVYSNEYWWSDHWDPLATGREYDPSRSFFEQLKELQAVAPRMALFNSNSENSNYANHSANNKNCFMVAGTFRSENIFYSTRIKASKDVLDCYGLSYNCERCYECYQCEGCYDVRFAWYAKQSRSCTFVYDVSNCQDCYLCAGIENKQFCIENVQYSEEEYRKKVKEISSHTTLEEVKKRFATFLETLDVKKVFIKNSTHSTGNDLINCVECAHCYDVTDAEHCRYTEFAEYVRDCMDVYGAGFQTELLYEVHGMLTGYMCKFCSTSYNGRFLEYADNCQNSEYLFGCVALKNQKYCILNKQYTKEEYEETVELIKKNMLANGEYGEFFPSLLSPFGYNESVASEHYPMSKEEALSKEYLWSDSAQDMPFTGQWYIPKDDINVYTQETQMKELLHGVLRCQKSGRPFKIVPQELALLLQLQVAIPRICPDERHKARVSFRNLL